MMIISAAIAAYGQEVRDTATAKVEGKQVTIEYGRPSLKGRALADLMKQLPPDPKTGATSIELDPLEWIHRITSHIPNPRRHCQRFYRAYSNRRRIRAAAREDKAAGLAAAVVERRIFPCLQYSVIL